MTSFTESVVEQAALAWLESVGWQVRNGAEIAPGEPAAERDDYGQVVLAQRLRDALARLNPALPAEALEDAFRKLTRPEGAELIVRNRALHRLLVDGVTVEYRDAEGSIRGAQARVIDFDDPAGNDWLAVNQFSVVEHKHSRRPDVVLCVNGLPLAVVELKNAADENATIWSAFWQLQTYKAEVPSLFAPNVLLTVSDGVEARVGTLTAGREWFKPWRTIGGEALADAHLPELQVVIEGLCAPRRFLDLLRDFIVFEDDGGRIAKKMAGYHQFHAVQVAVGETLRAAELRRAADRVAEGEGRYEAGRKPGDRRVKEYSANVRLAGRPTSEQPTRILAFSRPNNLHWERWMDSSDLPGAGERRDLGPHGDGVPGSRGGLEEGTLASRGTSSRPSCPMRSRAGARCATSSMARSTGRRWIGKAARSA